MWQLHVHTVSTKVVISQSDYTHVFKLYIHIYIYGTYCIDYSVTCARMLVLLDLEHNARRKYKLCSCTYLAKQKCS